MAYALEDPAQYSNSGLLSTYDRAMVLLEKDNYKESEKLLLKAKEEVHSDKELLSKINKSLSLALCGQAIEKETEVLSSIENKRNTFLSGIVLVLFAAMILSLVLRYGPERPKIATELEGWVRKRKEQTEKSAAFQAGSSIFSLLIFALSAFGLFTVVMAFMWFLALFSPPKDGIYKEAQPFYDQAIDYLTRAEGGDVAVNKASVLSQYYKFKKAHGSESNNDEKKKIESRHSK